MYQYSLSYFASLFNQCITDAAPSEDLPTRLNSLLNYITEFMYKMVGVPWSLIASSDCSLGQ